MLKKYPKALDHITDYWSAKIHFFGEKNPHLSYNTRVLGGAVRSNWNNKIFLKTFFTSRLRHCVPKMLTKLCTKTKGHAQFNICLMSKEKKKKRKTENNNNKNPRDNLMLALIWKNFMQQIECYPFQFLIPPSYPVPTPQESDWQGYKIPNLLKGLAAVFITLPVAPSWPKTQEFGLHTASEPSTEV